MKHLGLVHILLLLGVGLLLGPAVAELTAYQNLIPSAEVGQMVTVTVSLTYNGQNSTQAMVTPNLPPGVVANAGGQSTELYPGSCSRSATLSRRSRAGLIGSFLISLTGKTEPCAIFDWKRHLLLQLQLCQSPSRSLGRER